METLTSKEFIEKLKSNSLKQSTCIKGIVKNSEKDAELLFKRKGDSAWITMPSSMIESVKVIKTFTKENETFVVVKLQLKTPTTPEGKVLFELLSSAEKSCCDSKCECGKFSKEGGKYPGNYCSCGCHHQSNCGCECNHQSTCGCGCHHQPDCKCGCQNK